MIALLLLAAQDLAGEASREVDRQFCARPRGDEVVVCGDRRQQERYRMPDRNRGFDPDGQDYSVMRERERWIEGGDSGVQSCGPVGPGGWTGCMVRDWARQRSQSQWGKNRRKPY